MTNYLYENYIVTLAEKFSRTIDDIMADYNFEYGHEFEVTICKSLRRILPNKYGICRGHVVSSNGEKQGDDIIIYDQERFPTLRAHDKDEYARKENIPIEAVYAYIEAKHTLNPDSLVKSFKQISAVKRLIMERPKRGHFVNDPYINYEPKRMGIELSKEYPQYRNPVFCMILSRFATNTQGHRTDNPQEICDFLQQGLLSVERFEYAPELIVAGKSNFLSVGYNPTGVEEEITPTLFTYFDSTKVEYENLIKENISFGIALAQLLSAIDWIRLDKMPWIDILNNAKGEI
ncbi:DUF6602 domain-containing protein [Peribacillus simplex]|uniref:DUF6602 domain-containing protein n=1 Tax=Peribacillus simplex TaxID=1478 RepID=UPI0028530CE3|nr:DUF6602 domain-containing protein [Peribacillus simplex]MDR4927240.1 hypothetical protein [Peribacillus simplex]